MRLYKCNLKCCWIAARLPGPQPGQQNSFLECSENIVLERKNREKYGLKQNIYYFIFIYFFSIHFHFGT